jgi:hypothetical protein
MTKKMKKALIYRPMLQNLKGITEPTINAENGCNHPFIRVCISKLEITPKNVRPSNGPEKRMDHPHQATDYQFNNDIQNIHIGRDKRAILTESILHFINGEGTVHRQ